MLMPSIFGENLFDDFFNDFPFYDYDKEMKNTEKKLYGRKASHVMKTDIREMENGYELVVDLPGFTKDEVQATLENANQSQLCAICQPLLCETSFASTLKRYTSMGKEQD